MAQLAFNPDTVVDDRPSTFDPMPDGVYLAQVIESDIVPTKSGTGQLLNLTYEIMDGTFTRRRIWDRLNIVNANATAQEIAQRDLKRLCAAIGHHGVLSDSAELHFKPFRLRVGRDKDDQNRNVPKGYAPLQGAAPIEAASAPRTQAAAPATAAAGGGGAPWRR